jgi:hypothetical protein
MAFEGNEEAKESMMMESLEEGTRYLKDRERKNSVRNG